MENIMFENLQDNELQEIDGGIPPLAAVGIGVGVIMGLSAVVSAFNGYHEAARGK